MAEGTWKLGPVELNHAGQVLTSGTVEIQVLPRPDSDQRSTQVQAEVSQTRPYLGEVLLYRLRTLHRDGARLVQASAPDYDGLLEEPSVTGTQQEVTAEIDGMHFEGTEYIVPLRAVARGSQRIGPAPLRVQLPRAVGRDRTSRGASQVVHWSSKEIPLQVRPVPAEGKPADYSGLVGEFQIELTASTTSLALGETLTLDVQVAGTGTLSGFSLPPPPADASFRVYDEPAENQAQLFDGQYQALARIRRAVVPEREGELVIPPIEISVFNPRTERFEWIRSEPLRLEVLAGAGESQVNSFGKPQTIQTNEALGTDILPATLSTHVWSHSSHTVLSLVLLMPMLPLLGLLGLGLRSHLHAHQAHPHRTRILRLQDLPSDPVARLTELASLVHQVMAERLGLPLGAINARAAALLGQAAETLYVDLLGSRYGNKLADDLERRATEFIRGRGK
jgi:hypothetical protein